MEAVQKLLITLERHNPRPPAPWVVVGLREVAGLYQLELAAQVVQRPSQYINLVVSKIWNCLPKYTVKAYFLISICLGSVTNCCSLCCTAATA